MRARRFSALITENGATSRTRTLQIAVGNGRFYGGGTVVAEQAAIDDGHLDLYSLELAPSEAGADAAELPLRRARRLVGGRTLRGTEFEIRTRRPRRVNADGELIAETPRASSRCTRARVTVFWPPAEAVGCEL